MGPYHKQQDTKPAEEKTEALLEKTKPRHMTGVANILQLPSISDLLVGRKYNFNPLRRKSLRGVFRVPSEVNHHKIVGTRLDEATIARFTESYMRHLNYICRIITRKKLNGHPVNVLLELDETEFRSITSRREGNSFYGYPVTDEQVMKQRTVPTKRKHGPSDIE